MQKVKTHINQLIQSLSANEIRVVDDYLQKLKPLFNKEEAGELKEIKLFKLLTVNKNRTITDAEIIQVTKTERAASLKTNLYHKVIEALTFDKHITNTAIFNEYDITSFTLKKKLLFFNVSLRSLNQGKTEALNELLNEIINTGKEYELYDVLIEALTAKKYFKGLRSGIKEFDDINNEIDFYGYCLKALQSANDCYYRVILNHHSIKSFSQKELHKYLSSSIKQMEDDYKKTKSQRINYYLHIIHFAASEFEKKYLEAIDYCNKLIFMLKKNKVVYRKERMGFVYDNISQFEIFLGDYKAAAMNAKKAQEYYIEGSFENIISTQQEFYAHIYSKNLDQAYRCTKELLEHSLLDSGEFLKSKYIYFQSCVLFASKKYKEALDILKMSLEIETDKTRWNISLRILNIMLFIELNKLNEASRALESLRKHMERQIKEEEVKPRDILIVKLLRELEKDGFEFQAKNVKVTTMLKELSEKDTSVSWEHFSSELIPFHKWLEGKKL